MYTDKKVLLIAGGGTLGTYVAKELLRLGAWVDVICPEPKVSDHPRLTFHQSLATKELLSQLFEKQHYHGIVNFIHYTEFEPYKAIHPFLIEHTDHLIFLSSYRVYANEQHPITENAPRLFDVLDDPYFHEKENYAKPKSQCEDYLRTERAGDPFTIVRPVISFSARRMDLYTFSGHRVIEAAAQGETLLLPQYAKDFGAGLDWAGNSGKLIAHLLFKPHALGNTYTIYSGQGLTWGDVAALYEKLIGLKVRWCEESEFLSAYPDLKNRFHYLFDRRFNRTIDCSKVLEATGLSAQDFASVEDGIRHELAILENSKN